MADALEQFERLKETSIEDAVRWAIRDAQERRDFKAQWPMYQTEALRRSIEVCKEDIELYEAQIKKAMQAKREYEELLALCEKRDVALSTLAQRRKRA